MNDNEIVFTLVGRGVRFDQLGDEGPEPGVFILLDEPLDGVGRCIQVHQHNARNARHQFWASVKMLPTFSYGIILIQLVSLFKISIS
jgi:hypothetical protein